MLEGKAIRPVFFGAFALVYSLVFLLSLPDFGLTWDSALGEFYFGDKLLEFWRSFDPAALDLARTELEVYTVAGQPDYGAYARWAQLHPEHLWSLGPFLSSLSREVFFTRLGLFDSVTAQHVFLLPLMLLLFAVVYRFAARVWTAPVGVLAVFALAVHPRLWADAHNNIKDVPAAVFFSFAVAAGFGAFTVGGVKRFAVFGFGIGLALAAKANAWLLFPLFGLWLAGKGGERRLGSGALAAVFGISIFLLLSPHLLADFPARLVGHARYLIELGGAGGPVWKIMPSVNLLATLPGTFVPLLVLGLVVLFREPRHEDRAGLLLLLWLALPVLRVSLPYANDFDVIRHWEEVLPAASILVALGAARILESLSPSRVAQAVFASVLFAPAVWWNAANHPFNLCFYNSWAGGLAGAQAKQFPQSTDYWGSSYRTAITFLNTEAESNALIFAGVGQHILQAVAPVWLRPDLSLGKITELRATLDAGPAGPVYLVYITRRERYPEIVRELDGAHAPEREFLVDGAPVLRILRFGPRMR